MKQFLIKTISFFALWRFRVFHKNVQIGKGVVANFKTKISGCGQVVIEDGVNLWAHAELNQFITFDPKAEIVIGKNSRINGGTFLAREKISIGENNLIGSAIFLDNDFHSTNPNFRFDKAKIPTSPIETQKNVWVGGQASILKGVKIGENAVVGFRSVVTKNVEKNTVVAGNPARVVKKIDNLK